MNGWLIGGTTFLASAVEMVEAATIVMAVGFTQGWRTALTGAASALAVLAVAIGLFGPLLATHSAVRWIEIVVGPVLLWYGATWLRKVILRFSGRKALHDEAAIYERQVVDLKSRGRRAGFVVSFQGVLVEGIEVAVIVVTFAATQPQAIGFSIGGALLAALVVAVVAFALRAPLSRVPENLMKAIVGVMLVSLGTMWTGEAIGLHWWAGDATLFYFVAGYAAIVALSSRLLRVTAS